MSNGEQTRVGIGAAAVALWAPGMRLLFRFGLELWLIHPSLLPK